MSQKKKNKGHSFSAAFPRAPWAGLFYYFTNLLPSVATVNFYFSVSLPVPIIALQFSFNVMPTHPSDRWNTFLPQFSPIYMTPWEIDL